jgi:hypothetical protein
MSHLHHKLSALVDGELSASARRRALAHLRVCDECRGELHATIELKRRLTGLRPSEPSADLFSSLDSMPSSAATSADVVQRWTPIRRVLVGAGTVSIAFVSLAYAVGAPHTASVAAVAPPVEEANAEFAANAGGYGLSDPAVDALLTKSVGLGNAGDSSDLTSIAFGIGAATAVATMRRGDDAAAIALLHRAVRAPDRVAYRGVRIVSDHTSAVAHEIRVSVDHVPRQGTSYRVLGGDRPGAALFIDGLSTPVAKAEALNRVSVLARTYDVGVVAHRQMLGRSATVVGVGDKGVLVASLWIDDATGVLLDRELYDNGALVRASRFETLQISSEGFLSHPPPELPEIDGADLSTRDAGVLDDEGWSCPKLVGDGLTLTALGLVGSSGELVEAVYSDGISSASLFEQHGSLDRAALAGYQQVVVGDAPVYVRNGLPSTWVWQSSDTVYTMLSDAPAAQIAAAIDDLPHEQVESAGGLDRVGRGLGRIGRFLDPAS